MRFINGDVIVGAMANSPKVDVDKDSHLIQMYASMCGGGSRKIKRKHPLHDSKLDSIEFFPRDEYIEMLSNMPPSIQQAEIEQKLGRAL